MSIIEDYAPMVGEDVIHHLRELAGHLQGMKVVHVNSTKVGGGVAEILVKLVPLMKDLGLDAHWEVIRGEEKFYECTKNFHNGSQGRSVSMSESLLKVYE